MADIDTTQEVDASDFEFDPRPFEGDITLPQDVPGRIAIVRTSDRAVFRRCRRRWGWSSHLRQGLGPLQNADPLWLGSGVHYALEDYHGYKFYSTAVEAFRAYTEATIRQDRMKVPAGYKELLL